MFVLHHLIFTAFLGIIGLSMQSVSLLEVILFLLGGTIIDIDHVFSYWYYNRIFSLDYHAIKTWCIAIGYKMEHFFVFHNIWFVTFIGAAVWLLPNYKYFFWGLILHILLDLYWDGYWYYIMKKNVRPYRRWIAPLRVLRLVKLEKYL